MRRELELRAVSPGNSIYIETGCQLKFLKYIYIYKPESKASCVFASCCHNSTKTQHWKIAVSLKPRV